MANLTHIELAPGQRLPDLDADHEQAISVAEGVIYVVLEEDELALTPGDRVTIPAGERRRAWNAGDVTARLAVSARVVLAAAA